MYAPHLRTHTHIHSGPPSTENNYNYNHGRHVKVKNPPGERQSVTVNISLQVCGSACVRVRGIECLLHMLSVLLHTFLGLGSRLQQVNQSVCVCWSAYEGVQ